jgi:hypothetical protein
MDGVIASIALVLLAVGWLAVLGVHGSQMGSKPAPRTMSELVRDGLLDLERMRRSRENDEA